MFWQHKTTYTAQQVFSSPQQLLKAARQYFKYIDAAAGTQPVKRSKKAAVEADIDAPPPIITTHLPYSLQGLCVYLGGRCNGANNRSDLNKTSSTKTFKFIVPPKNIKKCTASMQM